MTIKGINILALISVFFIYNLQSQTLPSSKNEVLFETSDVSLQKLFNAAECKAKLNIAQFGKYKVMVEGGGYNAVWLETQPIGGNMYAKRDAEIAKNNQLIFMDYQRADGRLPGVINRYEGKLVPRYAELQGNYLPIEAFEVYYWIKKDSKYLKRLYETLERYDNYLWKYRDSDNNGCLEVWGAGDTGEDHCSRFGKSYHSWMFAFAPTFENLKNMSKKDSTELCDDACNKGISKNSPNALEYNSPMPMESMDMMSYSYADRSILARISEILHNGQSKYWHEKSKEVQKKIKDYLWVPEKHACYDRDKRNKTMDILTHNNLRCMYFGSFDQQMADEFIKYHLLNPTEFWTSMPLPSIAANDPAFQNIQGNNWSGQPQGLTFQRSIRALENYGHYAELTMIGTKLLKVIGDSLKFTQQFDPFKCTINNTSDGYGPSILASLEFISRLYGIHMTQDKVYWSCLDNNNEYNYSQILDNKVLKMTTKNNKVYCFINGKEIFSFTKGIRVVSDLTGKIIEIVGIETTNKKTIIAYKGKNFSISVNPNAIFNYRNGFHKTKSIEFCKPKK